MPELIEIENGLLRRVERTVISEHPLDDALPLLERRMPVLMTGLPANTKDIRYDEQDPANKTVEFLIELPPQVRTIPVNDTDDEDDAEPVRLALPWTVFHFKLACSNPHADLSSGLPWVFHHMSCFHARESIEVDRTQWLLPAMLPNINTEGGICFGNTGPDDTEFTTLGERINVTVNNFYLTDFTMAHARENVYPWRGRSYERWEQETAANPSCWRDWPEWDDNDTSQAHHQLQNIFARTLDTTPMRGVGAIPLFPMAPTFGRAEDYIRNELTPVQRGRFRIAFANVEADGDVDFEVPTNLDTLPDDMFEEAT